MCLVKAIPGGGSSKVLYYNINSVGETSNNRGNWNHLKIIQKVPEQRTGKSRDYRQQPYWALHIHFEKFSCESTTDLTLQIALYAPWTVTTE
jgi:hypothetical protein